MPITLRTTSRRAEKGMVDTAFINMPFSPDYETRLIALVSSLALFGVVPTAGSVAGEDRNRLDRIVAAIASCTVSIHDLSWMGLDPTPDGTPRFNMPFELGIAVALSTIYQNTFVILDTVPHRLDRALSDARGFDAEIVDDTPLSVFRAISNVFHRSDFQPEPRQFKRVYGRLTLVAHQLRTDFGFKSLFDAKPFNELRVQAADMALDIRREATLRLPTDATTSRR